MATYDSLTDRTGTSRTAREIPETVAQTVIKEAVQASVCLGLGATFRMPAYQHRIPVLKAFAQAYWLNGATQAAKDRAKKQTTKAEWDNVYITPDELAVLLPVPDAWMADSNIAWEELRAEIVRAFALKIDQAILFGDGTPPVGFSGPEGGILGGINAAGNTVVLGTTLDNGVNDIALDLVQVLQDLAEEGYDPSGFATGKGFRWRLAKMRDTVGQPVYIPASNGEPASILGERNIECGNGAWDNTEALAVTGEFDKLAIGIRQDMTFSVHSDGVITDDDGVVIYNAVQEDGKILRAVMRLGYNIPNPVKALGGTFPFGALVPVGAS